MTPRLTVLLLVLAAGLLVPAAATADTRGPDYIASDNVEFIEAIKLPTGLTAGARVIGNRLFVTSSKDLEVYDITTPEAPKLISNITADIQFENEEVPTNGRLLGISSDTVSSSVACNTNVLSTGSTAGIGEVGGGCLRLYDVRDSTAIKELPAVPGAGDHTNVCVLDCSYFYGSAGTITDATQALVPGGKAKIIGNWKTALRNQGYSFTPLGATRDVSCHNLNEVRPGILITSCNPVAVISVNPEDGGSILSPRVLAKGGTLQEPSRFIHSAHWPNKGTDRLALIGGETNFEPQCGATNGAFMTFDTTTAGVFKLIDEIRPVNGDYLDSNPPAQVLGCSVHWYEEHPTFRDGGLVALAEYENGSRFLQVGSDGKIKEQGFFIPLGGSTSAMHWAPNSDVVYAVDYERGIDVLRWKGSHYVPQPAAVAATSSPTAAPAAPVVAEQGVVAGTEGRQPAPPAAAVGKADAVCSTSEGFRSATASPYVKGGLGNATAGPGVHFGIERREASAVSVDVFRVSQGRHVLAEQLVKRFRGRGDSFHWDGKAGRRALGDGVYFARFSMTLKNGRHDVRRATLVRKNGTFRSGPAFYLRDTCGALEAYKLQRPVFGGNRSVPLRISYRLTTGADAVTVTARSGAKVIRTFRAAGGAGRRTYRLALAAKGVMPGDVKVTVTITRANAVTHSTLTARRL